MSGFHDQKKKTSQGGPLRRWVEAGNKKWPNGQPQREEKMSAANQELQNEKGPKRGGAQVSQEENSDFNTPVKQIDNSQRKPERSGCVLSCL
ncbi:hypothetical protein JTE90_023273 [Oedothorax gibbosus]|uniref:Uncharacterized protein n=1 Tax=Oedothorax gibbosus TaxID=931172 RepID=A0AAV6THG3_9ARAC|nr:hypothetical protein JTE90_023273 [Oedothorax gibbosus]